jgi:serine/threonine protein kinase
MTLQTALSANSALIPADALRTGTRLEDYEIDCVVARSAMAMVYRAQDRRSKQAVAIKEFLPTGLAMRGDDGQVVARESSHEHNFQRGREVFLEEAKALATYDHACLMRVLSVLECHGTVYKVMPYCPGSTLLEHRQRMPAAPTQRLLRTWLEGLLGALALWHEAGRVHGAVSPGNILMLSDDRPVLLDSDAVHAAILSDSTRSMIAALEPCFSPQEQCEPAPARPLGPWTDLYALAATLRFCVSGQLPGTFAQRPRGAWFESAARCQASAGEAVGAVGRPCWAALDACLAESAKDRPQSVAQLTRLLDIDRPVPRAGMESVAAGLAPRLSIPVVKSPELAARPGQTTAEEAARDAEPDVQDASQTAQQASDGVVQLRSPLVMSSSTVAATVDADAGNGVAKQHEATVQLDAALSAEPGLRGPADVLGTASSRSRIAKVAGSLMLMAIVAGAVSMWLERARPGADVTQTSGAARVTAPSAQPPVASAPAPPSTRQPVAQTDIWPAGKTDARVNTQTARSAASIPPQSKPASPTAPRKPVAAKGQGQPPTTLKSQARETSPRQACAGKERYALLQCMETQCAKKAWTRHEQCVRLRKDRKL